MSEVRHHVFESNTTRSTTSTTAVTAETIGTLSTELVAGVEYIGIVSALVGGNTTSNNQRRCEIHDNGTLIANTDQRIEPNSSTDGHGNPYNTIFRFTKAASGDVTFEHYNPDGQTTRTYAVNAIFIALDDLVENTDFLWSEVTTTDTNVSAYTDGASVTVPAGTTDNDWLALAAVKWDVDTIGEIHKLKIVDDATDRAEVLYDTEDVNEYLQCMTGWVVQGAAGSKTCKLQYDAGGTGGMLRNAIFLLRLAAFKDSAFATGGSATVTAADTWTEVESLAFTSAHSGNYAIIGGCQYDGASNSNRRERRMTLELNAGGETDIAGSATRQLCDPGATSSQIPVMLFADEAITSGDSVDVDLDCGDSVNSANETFQDAFMCAFSWELPGAGIVIPVPTGPWR